jgi:hypothetical protein
MNPNLWDFNLNFQISDGFWPLDLRDGPEAVSLQGHEDFENIFLSKQSFIGEYQVVVA